MDMKICNIGRGAAVGLAFGMLASYAQATPMTSDVTFRTCTECNGLYQDASAVSALQAGNDSVSDINNLFPVDPWALLDKSDEAGSGTVYKDVFFELTTTAGTSGTWTLKWSGTGLPLTMDFVFVTKASNNWAAYLFKDILFTDANSPGDGTFTISWFTGANGTSVPDISHASIYGRDSGDGDETGPGTVPLPGTLLLIGLGLLGLGHSRRRAP